MLLEDEIISNDKNSKKVLLRVNEFKDKTGRVAIVDEENFHRFLDVEKVEKSVTEININESYFSLTLTMGDKKKILNRQAYTTLAFLEDAGGVQASILAIAFLVNLVLTSPN